MASISAAIGSKQVIRKGFASASKNVQRPTTQLLRSEPKRCAVRIPKQGLQQGFRRGYADGEVVSEKTKKRTGGFFRWTWRLIYVSALGGLAYTGYNIYQSRNPVEQREPDPNKKTLVVLGVYILRASAIVIRTYC